jgi:hypothetical protein
MEQAIPRGYNRKYKFPPRFSNTLKYYIVKKNYFHRRFKGNDRITFMTSSPSTVSLFFFNWYSGGGVQLGPLGTAATNRPIVPAPGDYDDGEIGGMIGRENRSTRRKPAPVPLCPPQTLHADLTRTRDAAVGSQRLTA